MTNGGINLCLWRTDVKANPISLRLQADWCNVLQISLWDQEENNSNSRSTPFDRLFPCDTINSHLMYPGWAVCLPRLLPDVHFLRFIWGSFPVLNFQLKLGVFWTSVKTENFSEHSFILREKKHVENRARKRNLFKGSLEGIKQKMFQRTSPCFPSSRSHVLSFTFSPPVTS